MIKHHDLFYFDIDELENILDENPKAFWRYAHSKLNTSCRLGEIRGPDGTPISSDKGKADALNEFFATTFTDEDKTSIPSLASKYSGMPLTSISISEDDVYKKLVSLSKYKSAGPDGIHPCVLKATAVSIAKPLALIYNASLKEGKLPSVWKHGFVPGRSCVTQLLTVMEEWTVMLDVGSPIDVIYLPKSF
nr:uncharacterized protein LOC129258625 [Lytechinus pictus]